VTVVPALPGSGETVLLRSWIGHAAAVLAAGHRASPNHPAR
jgi:hypothetical protein